MPIILKKNSVSSLSWLKTQKSIYTVILSSVAFHMNLMHNKLYKVHQSLPREFTSRPGTSNTVQIVYCEENGFWPSASYSCWNSSNHLEHHLTFVVWIWITRINEDIAMGCSVTPLSFLSSITGSFGNWPQGGWQRDGGIFYIRRVRQKRVHYFNKPPEF